MHVHADASCEDWGGLVRRCQEVFSLRKTLGVWHPVTIGAPVPEEVTVLPEEFRRDPAEKELIEAVYSDSVVWAFSRQICDRLRGADFAVDHYGWGATDAVSAIAHCRTLDVVVDRAVSVDHPRGTGYSTQAAGDARDHFIRTVLSPDEFVGWQLQGAATSARRDFLTARGAAEAREAELAALRHRVRHLLTLRRIIMKVFARGRRTSLDEPSPQ
jgi:hypothetical protein